MIAKVVLTVKLGGKCHHVMLRHVSIAKIRKVSDEYED